jgi:hypothetical protein
MLVPLTLIVLWLPLAVDAGPPAVAPVTPVAGARATTDPGAPAKPVDLSQLPFTPDSITQVMRAHQSEIQACYEKTLAARDEKLQGQLMTHFAITAAGSVSKPQVVKKGTTLKDKDLQACVVGVLATLRFPKPPDGKEHPVEYHINLQPVE